MDEGANMSRFILPEVSASLWWPSVINATGLTELDLLWSLWDKHWVYLQSLIKILNDCYIEQELNIYFKPFDEDFKGL